MYVTFFNNKDGRMTSQQFVEICNACDFDPDLVLEVASCSGYSFDTDFYCDLETLVGVEEAKQVMKSR